MKDTIANSRYGVMPRWGQRLDAATIRMLTAYVHSLGGGEATPVFDEAEQSPVEQAESDAPNEGAGDAQS